MILGYLAFAWLLGVAVAAVSGGDSLAVLAAASLLPAVLLALRPRLLTLALLPLVFALILLGGWRFESTQPSETPKGVAVYNDSDAIRLKGVVAAEPEENGRSLRYRLDVREVLAVDAGWQPQSGGVLVTAAAFPRYRYGDLLELEGELKTPPTFDDFDYRDYLQRQGISSLVSYPKAQLLSHGHGNPIEAALIDLRQRLDDAIGDVLPEPQAALASGILIGQRGTLPADLRDAMNETGTSHLVAVSGQNVTLLVGFVIALLAWLIGRRPAAWVALATIIGYAMLVGGQPSVLRAAIMGSVWVLAIILGRPSSAPYTLLLAGAGMIAFDPQLAKDISFQLSFAATAGLMTLAPLLRERMEERLNLAPGDASPLKAVVELMSMTLAAIAFTLPITAVNFHRISLVAPLANLFAVPAFILVALTSAVAAGLATLLPPLAGPLAWLAWPPAAYMTAVVQLFAQLPSASLTVEGFGMGHAIAYGVALAAFTWALSRRRPSLDAAPPTRHAAPRPWPIPAIAIVLLVVLAGTAGWLAVTAPAQGRLSVTFLDVGQGDSVLIRTPAGQTILVDGGPSGEAALAALGRNLPFYDRDIDLVLLTHPQSDHMTGLISVLDRYDVRAVMAAPVTSDSATFRAWQDAVAAESAEFRDATASMTIALGKGALLQVLNPPPGPLANPDDLNENAVVLRLTMGDFSLLLTSDIGEPGETAVLSQAPYLRSTVMQVPHHGSRYSAAPEFFAAVSPVFAIVSVGRNSYGQPAPEALSLLQGRPVYRTDLNGDVTVLTDGHRLWLQTQRKGR